MAGAPGGVSMSRPFPLNLFSDECCPSVCIFEIVIFPSDSFPPCFLISSIIAFHTIQASLEVYSLFLT